jgi:hypothetical protein
MAASRRARVARARPRGGDPGRSQQPRPELGLRAVAALRGLLEVLEALQVDNARTKGWSWQDIAGRLGVTKQAVHQKHGPRSRPGPGR